MKKLTLVNVSKSFEKGIMPLGLVSIATYLKKHCDSINIQFLDGNCQDIYREIEPTDIVGISSVTQDINRATKFAKFVKEKYKVPIILGGVHISTYGKLPAKFFDVGVIGEGEETMLELMRQSDFSVNNLKKINGICFNENDETILTPPREFIKPIDNIPLPDRDITNLDFYLKKRQIIPYHEGRSLTMLTSRGCPFDCSFCSTKAHWQIYRAFSAERVVEEIELLVRKYKVEIIHIFDDLFIADKKRLNKICEMIMTKGLNKNLKFMCLVRSDMLDDETMKILKAMNVVILGIGMESGSQKVLKYLKNNTTTVQQNRDAIELAAKYRIPIMASFMVGNPYESESDVLQTLGFIKNYRSSKYLIPLVYISAPFPKTKVWDYAKLKKINVEDFDSIVMDIPDKIYKLKKAPLLSEMPLPRFFQIIQLFRKENIFPEVKKLVFMDKSFIGLLKAYIISIFLIENNLLNGIREVDKLRLKTVE